MGTALEKKRRLELKEPRQGAAAACQEMMCCRIAAWVVPVKSTRSFAALVVVCAVLHAVCELKKLMALLSSWVERPARMTGIRFKLYFSKASVFWHQSDHKVFVVSLIFGCCVIVVSFPACELHSQIKLVTVGLTPWLLLKRHEYLSTK